ncbi:MAG: hypothetical protein ACO3NW_00375 [Kiritimatiellia bacterium]
MTAEHLHLILNHVPVLGMALALIPLVTGILTKNRLVLLTGLILATVSTWMTGPVMGSGEEAYHRYLNGEVRPFLDAEVGEFLHIHEQRAEVWSKVMYTAAVLSLASLFFYFKKPKWVIRSSIALVVVGVFSVVSGIWIAESGGKIRRVDFREQPEAATTAHPENEAYGVRILSVPSMQEWYFS